MLNDFCFKRRRLCFPNAKLSGKPSVNFLINKIKALNLISILAKDNYVKCMFSNSFTHTLTHQKDIESSCYNFYK